MTKNAANKLKPPAPSTTGTLSPLTHHPMELVAELPEALLGGEDAPKLVLPRQRRFDRPSGHEREGEGRGWPSIRDKEAQTSTLSS
jgi:hypothetical protein